MSAAALGLVMLVAGAVGGWLSWMLQRIRQEGSSREPQDDSDGPGRSTTAPIALTLPAQSTIPALLPSLLEGVVASAVVPLFLALTGSNLVEELLIQRQWGAKHYHFLGLCLIAALGASAFLEKVSSTALGGVRSALNQSAHARREAASAQAAARSVSGALLSAGEVETTPEEVPESRRALSEWDEATLRVLAEFGRRDGRRFYTEAALRKRTDLSAEELTHALQQLRDENVAASINTQGVTAWYLTLEGKRLTASTGVGRKDES